MAFRVTGQMILLPHFRVVSSCQIYHSYEGPRNLVLPSEGAWEVSPGTKVSAVNKHQVKAMEDDTRRRLDAYTHGLLESTPTRRYTLFDEPVYKVDFLHRTVRDFLISKEMQSYFQQRPDSSEPNTRSYGETNGCFLQRRHVRAENCFTPHR